MKRLVAVLLAVVALGGGVAWFASWANDTCAPLDRLFGRSGCIASVKIANFSPLIRHTMSAQRADGTASLLGWVRNPDHGHSEPALVLVDLERGQEIGRFSLSIGPGFSHAVFAADGERAMISCSERRECAGEGQAAAIISIVDGRQLSLLESWTPYPRIFPGDPVPGSGFSHYAMLASGGRTVVDEAGDGDIALFDGDGAVISELLPAAQRGAPFSPQFTLSPSTGRVALTMQPGMVGYGVEVWETEAGTHLFSLAGTADYRTFSNPAWSDDERYLHTIRREGSDALIDTFRLEQGW